MVERKEQLQSTPCDWCEDKPEFPFLYLGPGKFRDSDYDFSEGFGYSYQGIPICGGCGGLGESYQTEDFEERRKRIIELRFEYFPMDDLPEPPEIVRLQALIKLENEIRSLTEKYGHGVSNSFAHQITEGALNPLKEMLEKVAGKKVEWIKELPSSDDSAVQSGLPAIEAFYSGDFSKGEQIFQQVTQEHPDSSYPPHEYATALITFLRDPEKALPLFIKSCELKPKKALHFYQTARCLTYLGRDLEALSWLGRTGLQGDFDEFMQEHREGIRELALKIKEKVQKTTSELYDITTNWGSRVVDDDKWAIFFSSEFGVEPNFVVTVNTQPGKQFISVARGNQIRDYHQVFGDEEIAVPLERKKEEKESPLGIVYIQEKESGILFWDASLSLREVEKAIRDLDWSAREKGLYDARTKVRQRLPEPKYIVRPKRSVKDFFEKKGAMYPVLPEQDPQEVMQQFDKPQDLITWEDPYAFGNGGLVFIAHSKDNKFLETRDRVFNDILIERGLTFQELLIAFNTDPELFKPLVMGVKAEVDERLKKVSNGDNS